MDLSIEGQLESGMIENFDRSCAVCLKEDSLHYGYIFGKVSTEDGFIWKVVKKADSSILAGAKSQKKFLEALHEAKTKLVREYEEEWR